MALSVRILRVFGHFKLPCPHGTALTTWDSPGRRHPENGNSLSPNTLSLLPECKGQRKEQCCVRCLLPECKGQRKEQCCVRCVLRQPRRAAGICGGALRVCFSQGIAQEGRSNEVRGSSCGGGVRWPACPVEVLYPTACANQNKGRSGVSWERF